MLAWDYVVPPGVWTHLAFVATPASPAQGRPSRVSLFAGGVYRGSLTLPSESASLPMPMATLGSREGSSFHGDLHEARFWRVARPPIPPLEIRWDIDVHVRVRDRGVPAACL